MLRHEREWKRQKWKKREWNGERERNQNTHNWPLTDVQNRKKKKNIFSDRSCARRSQCINRLKIEAFPLLLLLLLFRSRVHTRRIVWHDERTLRTKQFENIVHDCHIVRTINGFLVAMQIATMFCVRSVVFMHMRRVENVNKQLTIDNVPLLKCSSAQCVSPLNSSAMVENKWTCIYASPINLHRHIACRRRCPTHTHTNAEQHTLCLALAYAYRMYCMYLLKVRNKSNSIALYECTNKTDDCWAATSSRHQQQQCFESSSSGCHTILWWINRNVWIIETIKMCTPQFLAVLLQPAQQQKKKKKKSKKKRIECV